MRKRDVVRHHTYALFRRLRPLFVILISLVFAFFLAEGILQWVFPEDEFPCIPFNLDKWGGEQFVQDTYLLYTLKPNVRLPNPGDPYDNLGECVFLNSFGYVGSEFSLQKNGTRIVVFGDSVPYFGCAEWSYPQMLEKYLKEKTGNDFEVLNAGVPGYSLFQGERRMKRDVPLLNPDIVLVNFGWNEGWFLNVQDKEYCVSETNQAAFLFRTKILQGIRRLLFSKRLANLEKPMPRMTLDDFNNSLNNIVSFLDERRVTPVFLTAPTSAEIGEHIPEVALLPGMDFKLYHEQYNMVIRDVAKDKEVLLVDLAREIDDLPEEVEKGLFPADDPIHPNFKGRKYLAEKIAEQVLGNYSL